jgi:hypothetical protein
MIPFIHYYFNYLSYLLFNFIISAVAISMIFIGMFMMFYSIIYICFYRVLSQYRRFLLVRKKYLFWTIEKFSGKTSPAGASNKHVVCSSTAAHSLVPRQLRLSASIYAANERYGRPFDARKVSKFGIEQIEISI